MALDHSRVAVSIFISLVSLGAAYATLNKTPDRVPDPVREMYAEVNDAFARHWKAWTGIDIVVGQAQGKSGAPVRLTLDGLDVPAHALSYDIVKLQEQDGLKSLSVQKRIISQNLPRVSSHASPYTSTIVFVVRAGNPQNIRDWEDLADAAVEVVVADPRAAEEGRWGYLAAWAHALKQSGGDEAAAFRFVEKLFAERSPYPDLGPGATANTVFVEHGVGDVLLAWENEAHLLIGRYGADRLEVVTPSRSIAVEPVISVVDTAVIGNSARSATATYIDYLFTPEAQDIAGKHHFRPRDPHARARYESVLPPIELFSVDEVFGGWHKAQAVHFAKGGTLERLRADPTPSEFSIANPESRT